MTYSSQPVQIPFLAGNYPTEEDRNKKGGYPIVIKKEPSIQHLQNVVTNYKDNVAPEQYQRPLSWSPFEKKSFLESLFMDRVEGVIVLVNIIKALHRMGFTSSISFWAREYCLYTVPYPVRQPYINSI